MLTLQQLQKGFQTYLDTHSFDQQPSALYEPVNYILQIGGKRLRPVLLLMGTNLFNASVEAALPAAYAVEIFHNFSLLHDDIMDNAPLRRGQPAVHVKYGVDSGILSGDVMLIYAVEYLLQVPDYQDKAGLVHLFNQVAIEVCEGQQYDMNFEKREKVQVEEYLRMIELKTAALIGGGLQIGALIGGATKEDAQQLAQFGRKLGIAFQLQDDILDTFGDPAKFGKKVGGDIAQNKKTFLLIRALEQAHGDTQTALNDWLHNEEVEEVAKIKGVTQIYEQLGVRIEAERLMERYLAEAFEHLDILSIAEERKLPLRTLANQLMRREM